MVNYPLHTLATAPGGSKPYLALAKRMFGEVPNLAATLAESPPAIEAYFALADLFSRSSLGPAEQQIVLLTASIEQDCHYCVAVHRHEAERAGVSADTIAMICERAPLAEARLEALRAFTTAIIRQRGQGCDAATATLLAYGFTRAALLDIVLGVSLKMFSNYVNHIAETPLDAWLSADPAPRPRASSDETIP